VRRGDLIVRQVGPETVVFDRRRHRAHCLGPLAAAVWRSFDQRQSGAEITRSVSDALDGPVDEVAIEVALRRLGRAGLVEGRAARPVEAGPGALTALGPGRREALRRVAALAGLAVLSIATPSPAQVAATCKPNNQPCTRSQECCSGCCRAQTPPVCLPGAGNCLPP
jgi:hypothetical protein